MKKIMGISFSLKVITAIVVATIMFFITEVKADTHEVLKQELTIEEIIFLEMGFENIETQTEKQARKQAKQDKKQASQDKKQASQDKKQSSQDKKSAKQDKKQAKKDKKEAKQDAEITE
jgi:uncharacterized protein (DUF3084 family)